MNPPDRRHTYLARQVGTLALSLVRGPGPMSLVHAAAWSNAMGRLGLHLPLFVVHDIGLLFTTPRGSGPTSIAPRDSILNAVELPEEARALLRPYGALLQTIASSEVVEKASTWRLRDELVAVLLSKILGDVYHQWTDPSKAVGIEELPLDPQLYAEEDIAGYFGAFDPQPLVAFLRTLAAQQLHVYTSLEQIDLDTLRLLGVFSGGSTLVAPVDLVDLFGVFQSAQSSDVVSFSLDLLPSVLETKRASGVQTFSVDGYASIERHGHLDGLILTEFAHDEEQFELKVVENELYYYGHEKQREQERRLQYLLVDASSSMRGVRQVFARGLALTLAKKMVLQGDDVWLRFFDSRLYETQKLSAGDLAAPYLLCFKSERGRNYARVFRQLLLELQRLRREERRQVIVYIITHGQCHIPVELVQHLRREAYLYGVFILPSSEVSLDYLELLHRHQIVDQEALLSRERRKSRALEILRDDAGPPRPPVEAGR